MAKRSLHITAGQWTQVFRKWVLIRVWFEIGFVRWIRRLHPLRHQWYRITFCLRSKSMDELKTVKALQTQFKYPVASFCLSKLICRIGRWIKKVFGGYGNFRYNFEELRLSFDHPEMFSVKNLDLLGIVEFRIYWFVLPILQANLGRNAFKLYRNSSSWVWLGVV